MRPFSFHFALLRSKNFGGWLFVGGVADACVFVCVCCSVEACVDVTALYSSVIDLKCTGEAFLYIYIFVSLHMYVSVHHHRRCVSLLTSSPEAITQLHCLCLLWLHERLHISLLYVNVHVPSSTPCLPPIFCPARSLSLCEKAGPGEVA